MSTSEGSPLYQTLEVVGCRLGDDRTGMLGAGAAVGVVGDEEVGASQRMRRWRVIVAVRGDRGRGSGDWEWRAAYWEGPCTVLAAPRAVARVGATPPSVSLVQKMQCGLDGYCDRRYA